MNLLQLSKQEQFYHELGTAISMNNTRCFINLQTLEIEMHPDEDFYFMDEEDPAQEMLDDQDKYLLIEHVRSRDAFGVMSGFLETVTDKQMQQRLTDALNGKKPFANFNNLVHNSSLRQSWFDFKDHAYTQMAKEWIEENATPELKEKIKALPAVHIAP